MHPLKIKLKQQSNYLFYHSIFFMTDTLCKGQRSLKRRIGQFALQGSSFVSFVPFGPFLIFPLKKLHSRSIHPSVEGMDLILAE